jgi:hypothetical protein
MKLDVDEVFKLQGLKICGSVIKVARRRRRRVRSPHNHRRKSQSTTCAAAARLASTERSFKPTHEI